MSGTGSLFGWAFGDRNRRGQPGYLDGLKQAALANAAEQAAGKGLQTVAGSQDYTVLSEGEALAAIESPQGSLVVRCTIEVTGPRASRLRAEGPMNG
ncbi:hypothetical protein IV498_00115 [Paenarthrobacter sp. Z7-10]|uniref:hypothetical protein n=1 Tax=Paenarthrobacter sp. Z7-10 TaxID=2787635 RepID=UPI0022A95154|nr:hypothetical protein [Paenarthrobacter sp. Z7-10]MCZ2401627.1 hypothetical protein [Paenarthrobacter sp. Z7-10]